MSRKILGLDIRQDRITALLMGTSIKGAWIENSEIVPLHSPLESAGDFESALGPFLEKNDVSNLTCLVALPPDFFSYRNIQVPFRDQKKINQILPFELESTLPIPVEDLIIDFNVLKVADKSDYANLLAATIEKAVLNKYLNMLSSLNIHPKTITAGSYSLAICLVRLSDTPDEWLYIDVDTSKVTVIGAMSDQICMVRVLSLDSHSGSESVTAKTICNGIKQILIGFEDILSFNFQPEVIFTTGCGLSDPSLEQHIEQVLDIPTQRINLIQDTQITYKDYPLDRWVPNENDNTLALSVTEIEGLKGLNFRKGSFTEKKIWFEQKNRIIRTAILVCVVLVLGFSYFVVDGIIAQREINRLEQETVSIFKGTFPEVKKIVDPLKQAEQKLLEIGKQTLISYGPGEDVRSIDILYQVSNRLPKGTDVKFAQLVIGDGNVQITGDTDTLSAVDKMKSQLEQAAIFKQVTISSANREKTNNRVRFKLKLEL